MLAFHWASPWSSGRRHWNKIAYRGLQDSYPAHSPRKSEGSLLLELGSWVIPRPYAVLPAAGRVPAMSFERAQRRPAPALLLARAQRVGAHRGLHSSAVYPGYRPGLKFIRQKCGSLCRGGLEERVEANSPPLATCAQPER